MIEYKQDVIAQSLDAIRGWTSLGASFAFLVLFMSSGSNRLRRMTVRPNPETEPSMPKVGWPVQSAFYSRNSHATRESSPGPCREAAQSNISVQATPVYASCLFLRQFPGAPDRGRWADESGL